MGAQGTVGRVKKNFLGRASRVDRGNIGEHFLLYNMGLYFNPRGAHYDQRLSFLQETPTQKHENQNGQT